MSECFAGLQANLIYIYRIPDETHVGCLKIGQTTIDSCYLDYDPNSEPLKARALKRIKAQTQTAGIKAELLHSEIAFVKPLNGQAFSFSDHDVHEVLERSGVHRAEQLAGREWFKTNLSTAQAAIQAVKQGRLSLDQDELVDVPQTAIVFRPEQREAIEQTIKHFEKSFSMIWNAKMRFGKTLTALEVVRRMDFVRTLILTHRPVVNDSWYEDFGKIFFDCKDFSYGSKNKGESFAGLECRVARGGHYVYFVSMQDLRGSELVGGKFDKNHDVFKTQWDLLIIDEAHEGTKTPLGEKVIHTLKEANANMRLLKLSGTPFNLLDDASKDEVFTWDYIQEQTAKLEWEKVHGQDEPNPYAELPKMKIFTYDLGELQPQLAGYADDANFNFREFFRVDSDGEFKHKNDVRAFLDLLVNDHVSSHEQDVHYPFATEHYREIFNHTLWVVPGVKEAKALSRLLRQHSVFSAFTVVNVAGDGDGAGADEESLDALEKVNKAIGPDPLSTHTITLTCGRLTLGVSVPAWMAVLMLSGSSSTAAASYMQTIFRVQTPSKALLKTECYVFDFAPDRALRVIAETARFAVQVRATPKSKKNDELSQEDLDRELLSDFLKFCPVISMTGSQMHDFDVPMLMRSLKKVYIERVVQHGFEDQSLYNNALLRLDELELKSFENLQDIIGKTKALPRTKKIDINQQGLDNGDPASGKQPSSGDSDPAKDQLKLRRKQRDAAISILRGISIRMPLMVYGAEFSAQYQKITIDNFADMIDDVSWQEFMPKGVTKDIFADFKKYYDEDIFEAACERILRLARAADDYESVEERIAAITELFSTFRNPDKETVLTPWRVVNMHMGSAIGGYCFFDPDSDFQLLLDDPIYLEQSELTDRVFEYDAQILEINSKSGLYPLYVAYTMYRLRAEKQQKQLQVSVLNPQAADHLWKLVLQKNIFVVCKSPMAKRITERTLGGFGKGQKSHINVKLYEDLVESMKIEPDRVIKTLRNNRFWGLKGNNDMKFNAIVGNPPYQMTVEGSSDEQVYLYFLRTSFQLATVVSFITPARSFSHAGKMPKGITKTWISDLLKSGHFKILRSEAESQNIFPNVAIAGGVAISIFDAEHVISTSLSDAGGVIDELGVRVNYSELISIYQHVASCHDFVPLNKIAYSETKFDLNVLYKKYPNVKLLIGSNGKERRLTTGIFKSLDGTGVFSLNYRGSGDIYIYGLGGGREFRCIDKTLIKVPDDNNLNSYKIIVPSSYGNIAIGKPIPSRIMGTPEVLGPNTGFTQTFISFGCFKTKEEADAALKYVKTKFTRTLLGILKVTQHNHSKCWRCVPVQNFTANGDIDWTQSISDIDQQLYRKYKLSKKEIDFIEKMIAPMD